MQRTTYSTGTPWEPRVGYCRAVRVGPFVSVSGTTATDAAGQLVGNLSGGQRSRASLACAIVSKPKVLILDEPTVGQDPVLRDELWAQFRQLAERGSTLVVSSHVMDEADRCDRLLLMREGEIVADSAPAELRERTGSTDLEDAFVRTVEAAACARA